MICVIFIVYIPPFKNEKDILNGQIEDGVACATKGKCNCKDFEPGISQNSYGFERIYVWRVAVSSSYSHKKKVILLHKI